jgi:hypothetical protein
VHSKKSCAKRKFWARTQLLKLRPKVFQPYGANGWMVGKNKMKSWPHSVGGWLSWMDQYKTVSTKLNHNEGIISTEDAHAIIDDIVANGW